MSTPLPKYAATILQAPDYHLRTVLFNLCNDDASLQKRITEQLSALRACVMPANICIQCKEIFNEEDNQPESCVYHPGDAELDLNADCWMDMYEEWEWKWLEENEEMMEEQPEGYAWSCCGGPYDAKPCAVWSHVTNPDSKDNGEPAGQMTRQKEPPVQAVDFDEESEESEEGDDEEDGDDDKDEPAPKKRKV